MCGIVAYNGTQAAYPIIVGGLKRLEYRGYDSVGAAFVASPVQVLKRQGKVSDFERYVGDGFPEAVIGIGHTRWATHGFPNDANAHPHQSCDGSLAIVHNGIIENFEQLKRELQRAGHRFESDTDTEVLPHLIEEIYAKEQCDLPTAVRLALRRVEGAYAIALISSKDPRVMIAARKGSPLAIGICGDGSYIVGSDASPIVGHAEDVVYLGEEEVAVLTRGEPYRIMSLDGEPRTPQVTKLTLSIGELQMDGYNHFMQKEIFQQPATLRDAMRGRLNLSQGAIELGGLKGHAQALIDASRITFVACGTSWHASLVGRLLFQACARVPVDVEIASEFRYSDPVIEKDTVVIAVSQSGETADTLAAIELAKKRGATVLGVTNVVGSSIARATDAGCYIQVGPEIGVASTKAFTGQVALLAMMALYTGLKKGTLSPERFERLMIELDRIPHHVETVLKRDAQIRHLAMEWRDTRSALFLGRGSGMPVALEGALKLKEISYIHAEGYPAGEMKHGPIALIEPAVPTVVIATRGPHYDKVINNIREVKARGGKVVAIATEGDQEIARVVDEVIRVPMIDDALSPLLTVIPMQLLAYHAALARGTNVDQPRNLAKSVTVE